MRSQTSSSLFDTIDKVSRVFKVEENDVGTVRLDQGFFADAGVDGDHAKTEC